MPKLDRHRSGVIDRLPLCRLGIDDHELLLGPPRLEGVGEEAGVVVGATLGDEKEGPVGVDLQDVEEDGAEIPPAWSTMEAHARLKRRDRSPVMRLSTTCLRSSKEVLASITVRGRS